MMERRRFARIEVSLQLKFKSLAALEDMRDGHVGNLSLGGLFLRTAEVKPTGTRVQIELPDLNGGVLAITGAVRSVHYDQGKPSGMGIEFDPLSDSARGVIEKIVEKSASGNQRF
jgi:c-di-GMP-binding flagellar brake protein YcgR